MRSSARPIDATAPGDGQSVAVKGKRPVATGSAETVSTRAEKTCVEKLSRLFPNALPVRIPVQVEPLPSGQRRLQEQTIIEYGTAKEVLFASSLPLEFEDRVRLVNADGTLDARATVVAIRYHDGSKAVAARFLGKVENWIIKS